MKVAALLPSDHISQSLTLRTMTGYVQQSKHSSDMPLSGSNASKKQTNGRLTETLNGIEKKNGKRMDGIGQK